MHCVIFVFLCCIFMFYSVFSFGRKATSTVRSTSKLTVFADRSTKLYMAMSTEKSNMNVLVTIADGTEEIEAVTIVDTLVRAGAAVTVASVSSSLQVKCSRGVKLVADKMIADCTTTNWDLICLPGGMPGAQHLHDCKELQQLLIKQNTDGKLISAICAAPAVVLAPLGILNGKSATCYPAPKFRDVIQSNYLNENAVISDSNVITSQGPGTSLKFSLKLVEVLFGQEMSQKLAKEMCADV